MRFGCYGVKSGHTESFIAGDRERPIRDGGQKAKTRRSGSFYENLGTQKSQSIFVDFSIFHDDAKVFIWVGNDV